MEQSDEIVTELADLREMSLSAARRDPRLGPQRKVLLKQVERPRINLGTGPPGRAD